MTRIDGVSARRAGLLVRLVYRLSRRRLGREVDPIAVYAHAPGLLAGYGVFEVATASQHEVGVRLKALAQLQAAALVNCEFYADIGSALAGRADITEAQTLALPHYRDSEQFSPLEKLVLDFCVSSAEAAA